MSYLSPKYSLTGIPFNRWNMKLPQLLATIIMSLGSLLVGKLCCRLETGLTALIEFSTYGGGPPLEGGFCKFVIPGI
jgi:hypothetical protein